MDDWLVPPVPDITVHQPVTSIAYAVHMLIIDFAAGGNLQEC